LSVPAVAQQKDAAAQQVTRQQIEALTAKYVEAFNKGDGRTVAALYSADNIAINPLGMMTGAKNYEERVQHEAKIGGKITLKIDQVRATGKDAALAAKVKQAYVPYMESVVAFFEARGKEVAGHEIAQTLLIHASELNADAMPDLLGMFRRRGYRFISLEDALKDDAYRMRENYTGTGGFSWIHRWSRYLGMPAKGEPGEPEWIAAEYKKLRQ